ncbi:MAG: cyclic nucleotide-binding domain-containing protein [Dehalococcoidia bacterium]|nr:cyclic nucleotide-binding domain-containing protein [Dehalococcoidia bacterium]
MERQRRQAKVDTKEQLIKDLRGVDIFAGLSSYELAQIAGICSQRIYHAGELCAIQGEATDELRIINAGKVAVELRIEVAPYTQTLRITTLTGGNAFAYCSLKESEEPYVFIASGRCLGEAQIISIKASDLQRIFRERPSIERVMMKNMVTVMCSRLKDSMTQLVCLVAEMIKQGK